LQQKVKHYLLFVVNWLSIFNLRRSASFANSRSASRAQGQSGSMWPVPLQRVQIVMVFILLVESPWQLLSSLQATAGIVY
jgi:hypothetical protein